MKNNTSVSNLVTNEPQTLFLTQYLLATIKYIKKNSSCLLGTLILSLVNCELYLYTSRLFEIFLGT